MSPHYRHPVLSVWRHSWLSRRGSSAAHDGMRSLSLFVGDPRRRRRRRCGQQHRQRCWWQRRQQPPTMKNRRVACETVEAATVAAVAAARPGVSWRSEGRPTPSRCFKGPQRRLRLAGRPRGEHRQHAPRLMASERTMALMDAASHHAVKRPRRCSADTKTRRTLRRRCQRVVRVLTNWVMSSA